MDIFDSLFSSNRMLNEQLMGELRQVLPDDGISIAIVDDDGDCWASDEAAFERAMLGDEIDAIRGRIDDGDDLLVIERNGLLVAGTELAGDNVNCGYVLVAVEREQIGVVEGLNPLIQMILSQVMLTLRLIEKNNRLHHEKLRQMATGDRAAKAGLV